MVVGELITLTQVGLIVIGFVNLMADALPAALLLITFAYFLEALSQKRGEICNAS